MSGGRPPYTEPWVVSGFFSSPEAVEDALIRLDEIGVPRDLIEVVVAPEAAGRHYGDAVRSAGRETVRYAGIGALAGVVVGTLITILMLVWPGRAQVESQILIQLLGPNAAMVVGALAGGAVGFFSRHRPSSAYGRVRESPGEILVATHPPRGRDPQRIARQISAAGGVDVDVSEV